MIDLNQPMRISIFNGARIYVGNVLVGTLTGCAFDWNDYRDFLHALESRWNLNIERGKPMLRKEHPVLLDTSRNPDCAADPQMVRELNSPDPFEQE